MQYYYSEGDQQKGPVDERGLKAAGLTAGTLVWREGLSQWQPACELPELAGLLSSFDAAPPKDTAFAAPGNAPREAYRDPVISEQGSQAQPVANGYPAPAPLSYSQPFSQPGYPQQQLQYGGYVGQSASPAHGMSVASLVLGIIAIPTTSCYGFGTVLGILAIIFGHLAQSQSRKLTGQGNGLALAGLVCGYISIGMVVAFFLFFAAIFGAAAFR